MPRKTVEAMLRGIRSNRIIVGGYVDKRGGVCPMLAAHRNGGRTNFGTFARAWDAFTGAKQRRPRRASRREVRALEGYLETGLIREGAIPSGDGTPERPLAQEVREVKATRRRLAEAEAHETAEDTLDDVLARTYAEAEERRGETRALEVLAEHELDSADAWSAALERADAERP